MLKIRYGKGPDQALGQRAMLVLVMQHHFVLSPDGAAQGGLPGFLHSRCITYLGTSSPLVSTSMRSGRGRLLRILARADSAALASWVSDCWLA